MKEDEINLTLTEYQLNYIKQLIEDDYDKKGYAFVGRAKRFMWDKVMLEGLIGYISHLGTEHLRAELERNFS